MYMMLVPRRKYDFFDDFFKDPFFDGGDSSVMKTDIQEKDNSYELEVDLPGYKKEDIKMHMDEDGYLIINAKTNKENNEKDSKGRFIRKERFFGECSREFYLGKDVKEEDIKASFNNGTLSIEVPKKTQIEKDQEKKYIDIE